MRSSAVAEAEAVEPVPGRGARVAFQRMKSAPSAPSAPAFRWWVDEERRNVAMRSSATARGGEEERAESRHGWGPLVVGLEAEG